MDCKGLKMRDKPVRSVKPICFGEQDSVSFYKQRKPWDFKTNFLRIPAEHLKTSLASEFWVLVLSRVCFQGTLVSRHRKESLSGHGTWSFKPAHALRKLNIKRRYPLTWTMANVATPDKSGMAPAAEGSHSICTGRFLVAGVALALAFILVCRWKITLLTVCRTSYYCLRELLSGCSIVSVAFQLCRK